MNISQTNTAFGGASNAGHDVGKYKTVCSKQHQLSVIHMDSIV